MNLEGPLVKAHHYSQHGMGLGVFDGTAMPAGLVYGTELASLR